MQKEGLVVVRWFCSRGTLRKALSSHKSQHHLWDHAGTPQGPVQDWLIACCPTNTFTRGQCCSGHKAGRRRWNECLCFPFPEPMGLILG